MFKKIQDHDEEIVRLLETIAQNTGGISGDSTTEQTFNIDAGDSQSTDGEPDYFTTGPGGTVIEDGDWDDISFSFAASVVNVRFDTDVLLALDEPFEKPSRHIPLDAAESPFTIGGDDPIDTGEVWIKEAESASKQPEVHIIAYR